jgi:endonuclease-3
MKKNKLLTQRESPEKKKQRVRKLVGLLRRQYPAAATALEFRDPLQLLIATILSAQCTDVRVNIVTKDLFRKYKTAQDYTAVPREELEVDIRSTGFYRNKAKNIFGCCTRLLAVHHGKVPESMDELTALPGVGRKTANCVLGGAFGRTEGVVVDTHVARLSERLGLSSEKNPEKIEADLMNIIPRSYWYDFSNAIVLHGRQVCKARTPSCAVCTLNPLCPSAERFLAGVQ